MCGIYGYIGISQNAKEIVFNGLKKLEYRGYDSWGMAFSKITDSKIKFIKKTGGIGDFSFTSLKEKYHIGLGHTRWATHGGVTQKNAHPHLDPSYKFALVHNGIVENLNELETLIAKKTYLSDTDTERILHWLINSNSKNFVSFLRKNKNKLKGMNSFVLFDQSKKRLIGLHAGSPLVLGKSKTGYFVSSDLVTFEKDVDQVFYLQKNQVFELAQNSAWLWDGFSDKQPVPFVPRPQNQQLELDLEGFAHFTLKEIYQQPQILLNYSRLPQKKFNHFYTEISKYQHINMIGCGSAYHAALFGSYMLTKFNNRAFTATIGSEYESFCTPTYQDLAIYISQSGETADLISTLEKRKNKNLESIGITNRSNSTLERMLDYTLPLNAGLEYSVVSTKAFMAQISLLFLLSDKKKLKENQLVLQKSSKDLKTILGKKYINSFIKPLIKILKNKKDLIILGKGPNYPLAMEMALKLKEAALINAQAFAAGELKHGVLALIEKGVICISLMSENDIDFEESLLSATEVKARGGFVIGICETNQKIFNYHIVLPKMDKGSFLGITLIGQLLAYFLSISKKLNPDKPRNLAKSVTVK